MDGRMKRGKGLPDVEVCNCGCTLSDGDGRVEYFPVSNDLNM